MDSIVPAVFATGAECVTWPADFGLSVTSRLLDSLMEFLRAGRKCSAVDQSGHGHTRNPFPEPLPVLLMRRRSPQLLSRLWRCRSFPGFSAVWTFNCNSRIYFLADKVDTVKQGKSVSKKKKNKKKISVKVSTVAPCQNTLHVGAANRYRKIQLIGRLHQPRFKRVQLHQNMLHVGVAPVTEQSDSWQA